MQSSNQPLKLTTAQLWLVHSLETLGTGAIVTGAITAYGAVSTGNYDYKVIGGLVLAAVLAVLAKGWSGNIQGNANFLQAILDTGNDVKSLVLKSPTVMPVPVQPQGPLVTIHTTQAPEVQQVPPQTSIRSLNAFTVPPRPMVQPPIQMPVVQQPDIAAQNTGVMPVPVQPVPDVPQRSFDSGVLRAVQARQ